MSSRAWVCVSHRIPAKSLDSEVVGDGVGSGTGRASKIEARPPCGDGGRRRIFFACVLALKSSIYH